MDPTLLRDLAEERRHAWLADGVAWQVIDGPQTAKHALWLILRVDTGVGQLTVCVRGEAEMEWVNLEATGHRHYDLISYADLAACVTDLELAVGVP